jgi:hypothetical protein
MIEQDVNVTVECVGCKSKQKIDPRKVTEQPFCEKCYLPMIVIEATVKNYKAESAMLRYCAKCNQRRYFKNGECEMCATRTAVPQEELRGLIDNNKLGRYVVVPKPYHETTARPDPRFSWYRCNLCPTVCLTLAKILKHCSSVHGIERRKDIDLHAPKTT